MSSKIYQWTGIIGVGAALAIIWLNVASAPDNYVKSAAQKYFNKGDPRGAMADYNQALALDPKYRDAYISRGSLKEEKLNDIQGAMADYNQAIALDLFYGYAYTLRGYLKEKKLNDIQGAMADYNQGISLGDKLARVHRDVLTYLIENN